MQTLLLQNLSLRFFGFTYNIPNFTDINIIANLRLKINRFPKIFGIFAAIGQKMSKSVEKSFEGSLFMQWTIESLDIILRALLAVVALFVLTRLLGAKQISQLSFFDYVIGISIGSVAAEMTVARDIPYHYAVIAMAVFALVAVAVSFWSDKSIWARRILLGTPTVLIDNGKLIEKNLKRAKLDVNELLCELRTQGYFNVADIKYAIMETNGKVSLLPKESKKQVTCEDLKLSPNREGLIANIIIDGNVMERNLKAAGRDRAWLEKELKKQKCGQISQIFLATLDENGAMSVYRKGETAAKTTILN